MEIAKKLQQQIEDEYKLPKRIRNQTPIHLILSLRGCSITTNRNILVNGTADQLQYTIRMHFPPQIRIEMPEWLRMIHNAYEKDKSADLLIVLAQHVYSTCHLRKVPTTMPCPRIGDGRVDLWMAILAIEELNANDSTQPNHRHVFSIDDPAIYEIAQCRITSMLADTVSLYPHTWRTEPIVSFLAPQYIRLMFNEFSCNALKGLDWTNIYATGACIQHCFVNSSPQPDGVLDLIVDVPHEKFSERLEHIIETVKRNHAQANATDFLADTCTITGCGRTINVWRASFGSVAGRPILSERGWYQPKRMRVTILCAIALQSSVLLEYRVTAAPEEAMDAIDKDLSKSNWNACSIYDRLVYKSVREIEKLE